MLHCLHTKILPPPYGRALPTSLHTLGSTFSMTITCTLQSSFTFTQWHMNVSSERQRRLLQDHVDSAAYTDMYRNYCNSQYGWSNASVRAHDRFPQVATLYVFHTNHLFGRGLLLRRFPRPTTLCSRMLPISSRRHICNIPIIMTITTKEGDEELAKTQVRSHSRYTSIKSFEKVRWEVVMMTTMMKMRTCVSKEWRGGKKEEGTDRRVRTALLLLYGLSKKVI